MPTKVDSIDELRPEFLECRIARHGWFRIKPNRTNHAPSLQSGPGLELWLWECWRCGLWKEELIVYQSGERFERARAHYPDGYLIKRGGEPPISVSTVRKLSMHAARAAIRRRRKAS